MARKPAAAPVLRRPIDKAAIWQQHPRYSEWLEYWRLSGHAYEGDGPFLDGSGLVAHPRELNYEQLASGGVNYDMVKSETQRYKRRKRLARYENFAQTIIDTFVSYEFAKLPTREVDGVNVRRRDGSAPSPIEQWWQDVDGLGTHIDDFMRQAQTLANVFGHAVVVLDREMADAPPKTRAEEFPVILRTYTPLDMPDWLVSRGKLTACKLVEARERKDLFQMAAPVQPGATSDWSHLPTTDVEFIIWDRMGWKRYDPDGGLIVEGNHFLGEVPALILYAKRRARIPIIGRSLLGDPKVFVDHFNLVSEMRALLRDQVFSMLHIQLGPEEQVAEARARLGDHAGTDTVVFTRGGATFIAPADGPVATYLNAIQDIERKIYRLVGLPWEGDSAAAEAADSRRLKAMDLNRLLASQADEAEKFEYDLARLWYKLTFGPDAGQRMWDASNLNINYPDEFHTEDVLTTVDNARQIVSLDLGPTATKIVKKRAVASLLPDLSEKELADVKQEIEQAVDTATEFSQSMQELQLVGQAQALGGGGGEEEPEGDEGTQPPVPNGAKKTKAEQA